MTRVQLIDVTKRYRVDAGRRQRQRRHRRRRVRHAARTVRMRQDDDAAHGRRAGRPNVGSDPVRRSGHEQRAVAQAEHRAGVSEPCALSRISASPATSRSGWRSRARQKPRFNSGCERCSSMIELSQHADRMPAQLSGGQQQRVALARMLATDPRVLLFDEPLSALDRNLRDTLKYSILDLQRRTGKTAIYVTHDQSEAFAISDRIFVMNEGRIEQAGTQLDIYLRPRTEFVAELRRRQQRDSGRGRRPGRRARRANPVWSTFGREACDCVGWIPETCGSATKCWRSCGRKTSK